MTGGAKYQIDIQVQLEDDPSLPEERMREAVRWLLMRHSIATDSGLSIVIAEDSEVQDLNRQYRGVDAPTDVLSFPSEQDPVPEDIELAEDEAGDYLGDLILGLPYIRRQAEREEHALDDELLLAVIHGTLHLLGYDHDTPSNQDEMWAVQAEALAAMDVSITVPRFSFPDGDEEVAGEANPDD